MIQIEVLLLIASSLILISVGIAKFSDNLGVPALLLFIGVGVFAGSEGPGGIYFNDPQLAQAIGIIALVFILFSGGLETNWVSVKPVIKASSRFVDGRSIDYCNYCGGVYFLNFKYIICVGIIIRFNYFLY